MRVPLTTLGPSPDEGYFGSILKLSAPVTRTVTSPSFASIVKYLQSNTRTDGLVSLGVVGSAIIVALGFELGDPLIGLAITLVILRITWQSWRTIRES